VWAGVLPLHVQASPPVADPKLPAEIPLPAHLARYTEPRPFFSPEGARFDGPG